MNVFEYFKNKDKFKIIINQKYNPLKFLLKPISQN